MILNVSGRTDIIAFYTPWFMNRIQEGFFDVRNPFNPKLVSRIYYDNVDAIMFCTKNPRPILPYLKEIKKPILFHVTLTSYKNDIEQNVKDKKEVIEDIKELSSILGKDSVVVRYDPILLTKEYTVNYHIKAFEKLCSLLEGVISTIIISFVDDYKNVRNHSSSLQLIDFKDKDYEQIGIHFSKIAHEHGLKVQTCYEKNNLSQYGFDIGECFSKTLAYQMTGKKFPYWKARKGGYCYCVEMVDIGVYNTCSHFCKYCYANFDEKKVLENRKKHNPNSSLLIGELEEDDTIKERKDKVR